MRPYLTRLRDDPAAPLRSWPDPDGPAPNGPPFSIWLAAWAVDAAAELDHEFGPDIDMRVGFLRYPLTSSGNMDIARRRAEEVLDSAGPTFPACPEWIMATPGEPLAVPSGHDRRTTLVVRNDGAEAFRIRTNGTVVATIVDPTTHRPVGGFAGAQTLALVTYELAPGGDTRLPLVVGTASLDPDLGFAVPPGPWAYIVELDLEPFGPCYLPESPITVIP